MVRAAGFAPERDPMRFFMPPGRGHPQWRSLRPRSLVSAEGRQIALTAVKGDPHAAILAHPSGRG
jgi:hypothetical protein